jgi:hypothetical protein
MLRRTFGSNTEDVTGSWRKLHNEELGNLYPSPNRPVIKMIKSTRMK